MTAGHDFVGDDLCDHYAFREAKADWQIWITTGSRPLPRKVVITSHTDEARPQSVHLIDWNLKPTFKDTVFKFTPPTMYAAPASTMSTTSTSTVTSTLMSKVMVAGTMTTIRARRQQRLPAQLP
jgi:hypothetical protein